MPYEDAKTYRFNPFDLTKVWPHADYPLIKVGTMELNKNPENYFAQIEQATFAPSNFVPGIAASPDKMLQARIFSYADAHRYRVGTNHAQLPVNQPKSQVNNYSQDGAGRYHFNAPSVPVYAPNSVGGPAAVEPGVARAAAGRTTASSRSPRTPCTPRTATSARPARCTARCTTTARRPACWTPSPAPSAASRTPSIKERAIQYWTNVDAELGAKLRANLGAGQVESDAEAANKV